MLWWFLAQLVCSTSAGKSGSGPSSGSGPKKLYPAASEQKAPRPTYPPKRRAEHNGKHQLGTGTGSSSPSDGYQAAPEGMASRFIHTDVGPLRVVGSPVFAGVGSPVFAAVGSPVFAGVGSPLGSAATDPTGHRSASMSPILNAAAWGVNLDSPQQVFGSMTSSTTQGSPAGHRYFSPLPQLFVEPGTSSPVPFGATASPLLPALPDFQLPEAVAGGRVPNIQGLPPGLPLPSASMRKAFSANDVTVLGELPPQLLSGDTPLRPSRPPPGLSLPPKAGTADMAVSNAAPGAGPQGSSTHHQPRGAGFFPSVLADGGSIVDLLQRLTLQCESDQEQQRTVQPLPVTSETMRERLEAIAAGKGIAIGKNQAESNFFLGSVEGQGPPLQGPAGASPPHELEMSRGGLLKRVARSDNSVLDHYLSPEMALAHAQSLVEKRAQQRARQRASLSNLPKPRGAAADEGRLYSAALTRAASDGDEMTVDQAHGAHNNVTINSGQSPFEQLLLWAGEDYLRMFFLYPEEGAELGLVVGGSTTAGTRATPAQRSSQLMENNTSSSEESSTSDEDEADVEGLSADFDIRGPPHSFNPAGSLTIPLAQELMLRIWETFVQQMQQSGSSADRLVLVNSALRAVLRDLYAREEVRQAMLTERQTAVREVYAGLVRRKLEASARRRNIVPTTTFTFRQLLQMIICETQEPPAPDNLEAHLVEQSLAFYMPPEVVDQSGGSGAPAGNSRPERPPGVLSAADWNLPWQQRLLGTSDLVQALQLEKSRVLRAAEVAGERVVEGGGQDPTVGVRGEPAKVGLPPADVAAVFENSWWESRAGALVTPELVNALGLDRPREYRFPTAGGGEQGPQAPPDAQQQAGLVKVDAWGLQKPLGGSLKTSEERPPYDSAQQPEQHDESLAVPAHQDTKFVRGASSSSTLPFPAAQDGEHKVAPSPVKAELGSRDSGEPASDFVIEMLAGCKRAVPQARIADAWGANPNPNPSTGPALLPQLLEKELRLKLDLDAEGGDSRKAEQLQRVQALIKIQQEAINHAAIAKQMAQQERMLAQQMHQLQAQQLQQKVAQHMQQQQIQSQWPRKVPGKPSPPASPLLTASMPWSAAAPRAQAKAQHAQPPAQYGTGDPQFRRTKMCRFHLAGRCARGSECAFAHSMQDLLKAYE
eukprot:g3704.t1